MTVLALTKVMSMANHAPSVQHSNERSKSGDAREQRLLEARRCTAGTGSDDTRLFATCGRVVADASGRCHRASRAGAASAARDRAGSCRRRRCGGRRRVRLAVAQRLVLARDELRKGREGGVGLDVRVGYVQACGDRGDVLEVGSYARNCTSTGKKRHLSVSGTFTADDDAGDALPLTFLHGDIHGMAIDLVRQNDRTVGAVLAALRMLIDLLVVIQDGRSRQAAWVVLAHDLPVIGVFVPELETQAHFGGNEADPVVNVSEGRTPAKVGQVDENEMRISLLVSSPGSGCSKSVSLPCCGGHANDVLDGLASVPQFSKELLVR